MHMKKYKQKYKLTHQREAPDRFISLTARAPVQPGSPPSKR